MPNHETRSGRRRRGRRLPLLAWVALALLGALAVGGTALALGRDPAPPTVATRSDPAAAPGRDQAAAPGSATPSPTGSPGTDDETATPTESSATDDETATPTESSGTDDETATSTESSGTDDESATPTPSESPSGAASTEEQTALAACVTDVRTTERAVTAALPGVDSWARHVWARTDLLAGRASKAETEAVWDETVEVGPAQIREFRAADAARARPGCEALEESSTARARSCLARGRAAEDALDAARTVIDAWSGHLRDTRTVHGAMDAETAQERWVRAWRRAPDQLRALTRARENLRQSPRCADA